jgi:hypothetical protein
LLFLLKEGDGEKWWEYVWQGDILKW